MKDSNLISVLTDGPKVIEKAIEDDNDDDNTSLLDSSENTNVCVVLKDIVPEDEWHDVPYERNEVGLRYMKKEVDDFYVMRKQSNKIDRRHLVILAHLLKCRILEKRVPAKDEIMLIVANESESCIPFAGEIYEMLQDSCLSTTLYNIIKCYFKKFHLRNSNSFFKFANYGLDICMKR